MLNANDPRQEQAKRRWHHQLQSMYHPVMTSRAQHIKVACNSNSRIESINYPGNSAITNQPWINMRRESICTDQLPIVYNLLLIRARDRKDLWNDGDGFRHLIDIWIICMHPRRAERNDPHDENVGVMWIKYGQTFANEPKCRDHGVDQVVKNTSSQYLPLVRSRLKGRARDFSKPLQSTTSMVCLPFASCEVLFDPWKKRQI